MRAVAGLLCLLFLAPSSHSCQIPSNGGPTVSGTQSAARPFGRPLAGLVYNASSDERSCYFSTHLLPQVIEIAQTDLSLESIESTISMRRINFQALELAEATSMRIYFVHEDTVFHNSLLIGGSPDPNAASTVFPDVTNVDRYTGAVVSPGDFVDIPDYPAHARPQPMLVNNGAWGNAVAWFMDPSLNDNVDYVRAFLLGNTGFLLLGFEDSPGGGDGDFNDNVFAIDLGTTNTEYIAGLADSAMTAPSCSDPNNEAPPDHPEGTFNRPASVTVCAVSSLTIVVTPYQVGEGGFDFHGVVKFSVLLLERQGQQERVSDTPVELADRSGTFVSRPTIKRPGYYTAYVYVLPCSLDWPWNGAFNVTATSP